MEKFNENLIIFITIDSHSLSSKNFIIELKHFTTKPAKIWGDVLKNFPPKSGGGRPPASPPAANPMRQGQILLIADAITHCSGAFITNVMTYERR